jgi:hypothetical protein
MTTRIAAGKDTVSFEELAVAMLLNSLPAKFALVALTLAGSEFRSMATAYFIPTDVRPAKAIMKETRWLHDDALSTLVHVLNQTLLFHFIK